MRKQLDTRTILRLLLMLFLLVEVGLVSVAFCAKTSQSLAVFADLGDLGVWCFLPMVILLPVAVKSLNWLRHPSSDQVPLPRDHGWRISVIVVEGVLLLIFGAGFLKPFVAAKAMRQQVTCVSNMKSLSMAVLIYAQDYDETLPPAKHWEDTAIPYLERSREILQRDRGIPKMVTEDVFQCPGASSAYSYAFNRSLDQLSLRSVEGLGLTVLLLESDATTRNSVGDRNSLPVVPRHPGGSIYGFADGHVKWVNQSPTSQAGLRWQP